MVILSRGIRTRHLIPFTLPDTLVAELHKYAKSKDRPMSRIVEDAVISYIESHP